MERGPTLRWVQGYFVPSGDHRYQPEGWSTYPWWISRHGTGKSGGPLKHIERERAGQSLSGKISVINISSAISQPTTLSTLVESPLSNLGFNLFFCGQSAVLSTFPLQRFVMVPGQWLWLCGRDGESTAELTRRAHPGATGVTGCGV